MWNKEQALAFIEASKGKVNEMFDELEEKGIKEIELFDIRSMDDPLNAKILFFVNYQQNETRIFNEQERIEILKGVK